MSEFYFDYKCIDTDDPNAGDKALDFMLCRNCPDGGLGIRVYIPPELSSGYDHANVVFLPDCIMAGDLSAMDFDLKSLPISESKPNGVRLTNSIYIKSDNLSGCGFIQLVNGDANKTFKFAVNFARKDVISYSILESKNGLTVRVLYPLIKKSIELELVRKKGSKPLLISDRRTEQDFLADKNGTIKRVFLAATGRRESSVIEEIDAVSTDIYDYRAVFADNADSKHYLLVDESEYTIEDRARRKRQLAVKEVDQRKEKSRTENTGSTALDIVTLGASGSGKSAFIASVYGMREENGELKTNPVILERITRAFDKASRKKDAKENSVTEQPCDIKRYAKRIYNKNPSDEMPIIMRARERYLSNAGSKLCHDNKNDLHTSYMTRYPITFTLGGLGDIRLYDTANGGLGEKNIFDCADCFIVTVDGDKPIKQAIDELKKVLGGIDEQAKRYTSIHRGSSIVFKNYPVAVVLTKHDLRLADKLPRGSERLAQCFDENCHVVREDMNSLCPKNGVYRGSALERHIDCSSYEIEHYFRSFDPHIIDDIAKRFVCVRYFTCSAFGDPDCIGNGNGGRFIKYAPDPLRVELPLVWLMYQRGLIR